MFRISIAAVLTAFQFFLLANIATGQDDGRRRDFISRNYEKSEVRIPMRDGKTLHTTVYSPRDKSKRYPILMKRTPYSSQPYGNGRTPGQIGPSKYLSLIHI